jgi:hypothetical protein
VVVALCGRRRVKGHRQRCAVDRHAVEGRHPDRAVAARLHVRLDRPDLRIAISRCAGDVDEACHLLFLDEEWRPGQRHEAEHARVVAAARVAAIGVEHRDPARGGPMLIGRRQSSGERQQLLVLAVAAGEDRTGNRRVDRRAAPRRLAWLERLGVEPGERPRHRIAPDHPVWLRLGRSAHEGHARECALSCTARLTGVGVDHGDPASATEQERVTGLAGQDDLAHTLETRLDGRSCGRSPAVRRRQQPGQLERPDAARVGATNEQAGAIELVLERGHLPARLPAHDLVAGLGVAGHDGRSTVRRERH